MKLFDESIFQPEFFEQAHDLTMKVVAGAEVVLHPVTISLGLSLFITTPTTAVAGDSICFAETDTTAHVQVRTMAPEPEPVPLKSTLTKDALRKALAARLGEKELNESIERANSRMRGNAGPREDGGDVSPLTAMRDWVTG